MQILSLSCYFNISFPSFHMNSAILLLPTVRGMWERGGGGNKVVVFIRTVGTVEMDPFLQLPWNMTVSHCVTFGTLMSARQSHVKVLKKRGNTVDCEFKILRGNTSKAFHIYFISPVIPCHYYHYFLLQRKCCGVNKHNPFEKFLSLRCFCSSASK